MEKFFDTNKANVSIPPPTSFPGHTNNIEHMTTTTETILRDEIEDCTSACTLLLFVLGLTIMGVCGSIIVPFITQKKLRKRPSNIMICNQACTGLFTAFVFIPLCLFKTSATVHSFVDCYMIYLSLFNLSVICADLYLAMNKPFIHRRYISVSFTVKGVCLVWLLPLVMMLIPLTWWYSETATKVSTTQGYINIIYFMYRHNNDCSLHTRNQRSKSSDP